ncbi:unnamed protein product [Hyaloperonospora brassicae]|uniref:Chromatin assembly factor 1 subunit A dimerization domain-containing protein n=1 Tax=Hyaloperonospora brassicae TaxID=162125 RepID=A0AAV0TXA2_HYABA|nr:unnamed protein product [Hyaloperonospora brassicae]
MAETKKGVKQATISAFFSPRKTERAPDATNAAAPEPKRVSAKRPRASPLGANSEANSEVNVEGTGSENRALLAPDEAPTKAKAKPNKDKTAAVGKTTTALNASKKTKKKKKKKQRLVRFTSPHAVTAHDSEDGCFDEEDDVDDEDDVFSTPEAKRARAELETGAGVVPAGALILNDDVVDDEEIVNVGEDDSVATIEVTEARNGDAASGVVDLTVVPAAENAAEPAATSADESKKARTKATTQSSAMKSTTAAATAMTKRQVAVKELATAAAATKLARVEPLDPVIQARVDTYKMKTDELTSVYRELSLSELESDAIMQDIYGVKLDYDLDVIVDEGKVQRALIETWQKLRDYARSIPDTTDVVVLPTTVPFPHEVKCFIVRAIQGRSASLSVVSRGLLAAFKKDIEVANRDVEKTVKKSVIDGCTVDRAASLAMEMEIKTLAQRIPHGVRPAKANVFEDTTVDALWVWEVGSPEMYFGDEAQKTVKRMRKHRKRFGQQLKTLAKVVQLLHQKPVDEAKVSAEEAKVGKFGFVVAAELQKAKDKEMKVLEKLAAAEEKKQLEKRRLLERQEAKDEEKRKRDREVEEKEMGSSKAQKKFKSFFATDAANSTGTCDSVVTDTTCDHDAKTTVHPAESKSTKIARMDAAIGFLGSAGDTSLVDTPSTSVQTSVSLLKGRRGTTGTAADLTSSSSWSSRRHRDPNFGVMKLLQFHENNRPAYYGTFSTRSRLFRGGRRPFTQYSKFDYTVDSDDEWEEEEPGESLSDDENDGDESDEDTLDYNDQWLAYEDEVDYMDDADKEGDRISGEAPASPTKRKLPSQLEKKRRAVKSAKLEPQIIGPFWYVHGGDNCPSSHFPELAGELLSEPLFESSLMQKAREYEEEQRRQEQQRQQQEVERQEQEKLRAHDKEDQGKQTGTAQATPEKLTAAVETKQPEAISQQLLSQKVNANKTLAAARSTPTTTCAQSPSPAKAPKQIDSWFKKVSNPVSAPTTTATAATARLSRPSSPLPTDRADANKSLDEHSKKRIDVVEIDCDE